jgi:aspartate/methionine/tyrosine aminotransferase
MNDVPERLFRLFESRVYGQTFKHLSGWDMVTAVPQWPSMDIKLTAAELSRYNYQNELPNALVESTESAIRDHCARRYGTSFDESELIITPGLSTAVALFLHTVAQLEDIELCLDPPYYFSYALLSRVLRLPVSIVRRTIDTLTDVAPIVDHLASRRASRRVLVLCDPRFVTGIDYVERELHEIGATLTDNDVLMMDHATDTRYGHTLAIDTEASVVRMIGLGKPIAFYGARGAVLIAPPKFARSLRSNVGLLYGALDAAMLKLTRTIAASDELYTYAVDELREHVDNAERVFRATIRTPCFKIVKPTNGFIGYGRVDLRNHSRYAFYRTLLDNGVHATFGGTFGLVQSLDEEIVRINFLLSCVPALRVISAYLE